MPIVGYGYMLHHLSPLLACQCCRAGQHALLHLHRQCDWWQAVTVEQRRVRGSSDNVVISSDDDRQAFLEACEVDKLAATSLALRASQLETWQRCLGWWRGGHMPMLPVEVDDIADVGSLR